METSRPTAHHTQARWLYVIAQTILGLGLIFAFYSHSSRWIASYRFSRGEFMRGSNLLHAEFDRFHFGRGEQLSRHYPPVTPEDRTVWAARIAEEFRQPLAVFVRDDSSMAWYSKPAGFEPGIAKMEYRIVSGSGRDVHSGRQLAGSMEITRISFDDDSAGFKAWIVGLRSDSFRWGVVLRWWDSWAAFFAVLDDESEQVRVTSPAALLKNVFYLSSTRPEESDDRLFLRATLEDQLLSESKGLKNTRRCHMENLQPLKIWYYQSSMGEKMYALVKHGFGTWISEVGILLMMMILYMIRRTSRKASAA